MSAYGDGRLMFRTVVSIHNLVGVPGEMAEQPAADSVAYLAAVRLLTHNGTQPVVDAAASNAKDVSQAFLPDQIREHNGVPTITFGKSVKDWNVVVYQDNPRGRIELVIDIAERRGGRDGSRRSLSRTKHVLHMMDVVERKIFTVMVGTSSGQLGLSLTVSPQDEEGYIQRLKDFVSVHNPQSLKFVHEVASKAGEIASFTRLFKKYNVIDYPKRVAEYFQMYGPEQIANVDEMLERWRDREEEFIRSLVLDNAGPEPRDIPARKRLQAFSEAYDLELDVDTLLESHGAHVDSLFADLRERHGVEPDPHSYLYPPVVYHKPGEEPGGVTSSSAASSVINAVRPAAPSSGYQAQPQGHPTPLAAHLQQSTPTGAGSSSSAAAAAGLGPAVAPASSTPSAVASGAPAAAPTATAGGSQQPSVLQRARARAEASQARNAAVVVPSAAAAGPGPGALVQAAKDGSELWSGFMDDLRRCHVPAAEIHYLAPEGFAALTEELGYPPGTRQLLVAEWQRRLQNVLVTDYQNPGEQMFESTKTEVVSLCQLDPININVAGVVSLRNAEHEAGYSVRLASAKQRASERFLIVGDYGRLMEAAKYGVTQSLVNKSVVSVSAAGPSTAAAATASPLSFAPVSVPGLEMTDGIVFHRRPFQSLDRPASLAVLVCDVAVGKPLLADHRGLSGISVDHDFHAQHDSVILNHGTPLQSTIVFSPQQVLPRYLVHCNIDPTVAPCPTHAHKPVEYYLVDSNAFACSQCIVLGPHRGARVITVEEACAEAKQRMADIAKDADGIGEDFKHAETEIHRVVDDLKSGKARKGVLEAAEELKRDAERRAAQMIADFDEEVKRRAAAAAESKEKIERSRVEFDRVHHQLTTAARSANPAQVLKALEFASSSLDLEGWRTHSHEAHQLVSASAASPPRATARGHHHAATDAVDASSAAPLPPTANVQFRMPMGRQQPQQPGGALFPRTAGDYSRGSRVDQGGLSYPLPPQDAGAMASGATAAWTQPVGPSVTRSSPTASAARDGGELYQKFMQLKGARFINGAGGGGGGGHQGRQPSASVQLQQPPPASALSTSTATMGLNRTPGATNRGTPLPAGTPGPTSSSAPQPSERERKVAKEQMSQGWAAYRAGDREKARQLWYAIYERNEHNAVGARARAYIGEVIERDVDTAAKWYERALRCDPGDVMTLFNYGVMLEGNDKKREALSLFETAARLGDGTAAKRAEALRRQS